MVPWKLILECRAEFPVQHVANWKSMQSASAFGAMMLALMPLLTLSSSFPDDQRHIPARSGTQQPLVSQ